MGGLVSPETDPTVEDAHRRGRILWALAASMAEKGYPSTTISDIARIARVSKTIVYAHFRDKEECLLELYSRATDRVLAIIHTAQTQATEEGLDWRDRIRAVIEAYFDALAQGPAVAWAALVEVQAAGRSALARRRDVLERYVDLLSGVANELAREHPDEVRAVDRRLILAAVGGINELMLARVERGEAAQLPEDAGVAADVLIGLLERRG
jgi:AcrR family transcriptional regulator